ncbi:GNAT family N-acetyltransferase [Flavobacteriaceae bacterium KMM 6897]|nr:GNAT family N-acetyltransferase [Flavobacteriaceae bacterium KMM 6897]MEB8346188.1 GNAT family N-acetyltransferase [Flavobacteriaceae bacterium KMM 6898]
MIQVTNEISLKPVQLQDQELLMAVIRRIYLPVYHHLWTDNGEFYFDKNYSVSNLKQELDETGSAYYFINYKTDIIGILRIQFGIECKDFPGQPATKLHRIYLDPEVQGLGIGQLLMDWTYAQSKVHQCHLIWLEAMDTQEQSLQFYKKNNFQISGSFNLEVPNIIDKWKGMYRLHKHLL